MLQLLNNVCPLNKQICLFMIEQCLVYLVQSAFPKTIRWLLKPYKYFDLPSAVTFCMPLFPHDLCRAETLTYACKRIQVCLCTCQWLQMLRDMFAVSKDTYSQTHATQQTRHNKTRGDGKEPKKRACGFSTLNQELTGRAIMKPQCACTASHMQMQNIQSKK